MMQCVRVRLQLGHLSVRVFSRGAIVSASWRDKKSQGRGTQHPTPHRGTSWTIDHGGVGGHRARDKKKYTYING